MFSGIWLCISDVWKAAIEYREQERRFAEVFGPPLKIEYENVKESMMGSYASVKKIAICYHSWKPRPAILFGYLRVNAQCTECKTWWAPA